MTAVLAIHSGGFSSRQWRKLAASLASCRVHTPDLIGYGARPWPGGEPFHFRQDVEMLASLLDEPAHVVGHSYGGLLALQLALARPDLVRSLALYEPVAFGILDESSDQAARDEVAGFRPYRFDPAAPDEDWLRGFIEWWQGAGAWDRLAPETKDAFRAVGWKLSEEVASLVADRTDRATYATITAPTLVLGGGRSPAAEQAVVRKLAAALPNATLRVFPELGHMAPITHAAEINAAIVDHISRS
ncbi:MAG: alpha/beta hydrolase [Kofleriaceae bacterium]|nr:alpha/beta hydrolase [Kofleriaceae bacterium]